jgi:hypothetical protein
MEITMYQLFVNPRERHVASSNKPIHLAKASSRPVDSQILLWFRMLAMGEKNGRVEFRVARFRLEHGDVPDMYYRRVQDRIIIQ